MDEGTLGEIRMFASDFAPRGWELCDGQLLPIAEYQALFTLLGTRYGGNGTTTFALPDLRGRAPVGVASADELGRRTDAAPAAEGVGATGSGWLAVNFIINTRGAMPDPGASSSRSPT